MSTFLDTSIADLATEAAARPFDCVVIGAGSSGLTAAGTLASNGLRVAVLEAGPAPFLSHLSNSEIRFTRQLSDSLRNQLQYAPVLASTAKPFGPNFSCLGGRGLFWNGAAPRFRPHDLAEWPIAYSDLAPHYDWAEAEFRVHRTLGQSRLAASLIAKLQAAGFAAEELPFAADVQQIRPGWLSAGVASGLGVFLRNQGQAILAGTMRLAINTTAQRILLGSGGARGVLAKQREDQSEILARSVVLAGGGIESVRLAALSKIPDESNRIGSGLQEHLFWRSYFDGPTLYHPSMPESGAAYISASGIDEEQWEIHSPGRRLFLLDDGTPWAPTPTDAYAHMIRSFAATEKRDANRVESREGPLGSATIHFEHSTRDRARMQSIEERGVRIGAALNLTLREARFADPGSSYHEAGGLDMGIDATRSVTNPDGAFHKVPNLLCMDAAAFPRIGAVNPHLTLVAMARRQSVRLAATLKANG